jgi:hypothetical protein
MRAGFTIHAAMVGLIIAISTAQASEVWVGQANGRMPAGPAVAEQNKPAKTAPEGTATAATTNPATAATNPATCNQANASSPACYSATQQTKGK